MSDTPRTDAAKVMRARINGPSNSGSDSGSMSFDFVISIDFARQLERENQKLNEALKQCAEALRMADNAYHGSPSGQTIIDLALSNPLVQAALTKDNKQST